MYLSLNGRRYSEKSHTDCRASTQQHVQTQNFGPIFRVSNPFEREGLVVNIASNTTITVQASTHLHNQDGNCFRAELPRQVTAVDQEHEHPQTEGIVHTCRTLNDSKRPPRSSIGIAGSEGRKGTGNHSSAVHAPETINCGARPQRITSWIGTSRP